jgi:glycosyltransferase involved in cell wall biosynthesis
VLSTGDASDYRSPGYFKRFLQQRDEMGVAGSYRILGVVPFADLAGLLRHSVAVLNPSLFEGWSTTVEEAKSLGKRVLLSDIAVHREQAPERGVYFDPRRPEELAEAIWAAWTADDAAEAAAMARAAGLLPARRKEFAENYAAIAREAVAAPHRS